MAQIPEGFPAWAFGGLRLDLAHQALPGGVKGATAIFSMASGRAYPVRKFEDPGRIPAELGSEVKKERSV